MLRPPVEAGVGSVVLSERVNGALSLFKYVRSSSVVWFSWTVLLGTVRLSLIRSVLCFGVAGSLRRISLDLPKS